MISLPLTPPPGRPLSVLALGAHPDDIEIGAGATLLQWKSAGVQLDVLWCVLSANGPREAEARAIFEELAALRDSGRTVLLVDQNAELSLGIADRGYVLERGRVVADGSSAALAGSGLIRRAYLGKGTAPASQET